MIGPRCIHCKYQRHWHRINDMACPEGKKRGGGFLSFSETNRFQPREKSRGGASEGRKDRTQRRLTKSQPCCACGTKGTDWNPVDPAHIRTFKVTQSDHPANMIPLCRECHRTQHNDGWDLFLNNNPSAMTLLIQMGWEIDCHPFQPGKLIMNHPEVA